MAAKRRKTTTPEAKRRELRETVRGYFERVRASHQPYTDPGLAATITEEEWPKARPLAKLLVRETIADWLSQMARAATEEATRADQPELPGVILYRAEGEAQRYRRSIRGAKLGQVRSYAELLGANATGAIAEYRKVLGMIAAAEAAGCGEEDDIWPYLSDAPAFPLGPVPAGAGDGPAPGDGAPLA